MYINHINMKQEHMKMEHIDDLMDGLDFSWSQGSFPCIRCDRSDDVGGDCLDLLRKQTIERLCRK